MISPFHTAAAVAPPMHYIEQRAAAHHEASHAVIAILLEATPSDITIRCEGGTWAGVAHGTWHEGTGLGRTQKHFQVAVAGPLGQIKSRAWINWPGAIFDNNQSCQEVIAIIRDGELQETSSLSLGFVTPDGSKHVFEVNDFNDIGDLEGVQSLVQGLDDANLFRLLGEVRSRLDLPAVWAVIGEVAESLCKTQNVSGHEAFAMVQARGLKWFVERP